MKRKYKALRVCGLVLVLLCVVKLVLVDIRYDNVLLRAAGFFVGGILCFGISLVYNLVDKWMGRRENAKTEKNPLQFAVSSCILCIAVTLIALKREVAAEHCRFSVERMSS